MSAIHFIGGEKGGVGKSICARLLSQYMLDRDQTLVAFDADSSHQTLSRTYADSTSPLDLDSFESIDQIMETAMEQDAQLLIDLPAQSERFLTRWLDDNEVIDLCEESEVSLNFWYVTDDGRDSVQLLNAFVERYGGTMRLIVVRNYGRGQNFAELDALPILQDADQISMVDVPALHAPTLHKIDQLDFSFWAARNHKEAGAPHLKLMERQRVKVWLKKATQPLMRLSNLRFECYSAAKYLKI